MEAMVSPRRQRAYSLKTALYDEIYSFDFHQAVRLLEAFTPGCTPLGAGVDPTQEAIWIKGKIDFVFAKADLESLARPDLTKPMAQKPQLYVNFMGLAGVSKPLPTPYGHLLYQRIRQKDTAGRDFLDIFNHRFTSILYRIHKKFRFELLNDPLEKTMFGHVLSAVAGLYAYVPPTRARLAVQDRSVLGLAAYFWQKPHSGAGLEKVLSTYFRLPLRVAQFVGKWVKAPGDQWTYASYGAGPWNVLGRTTVLGTKAWDQHGGIRIHLGPLDYKMFLSFLPGEVRYAGLCDLVRLYAGNLVAVDIRCQIVGSSVPPTKLGINARLGQTAWAHATPLGSRNLSVDLPCQDLI